jgi:hypothetical protein
MVTLYLLGLLCLGILVFFVVALVKAFTRKTAGWIITSVVMGLLSALMAVSAAASVAMAISRKASENGEITKVLKSKDNKYKIMVPTSWRSLPDLNPQATMAAGNVFNEQYLMVLIEDKSTLKMDLAGYMTSTADRMESMLKDGRQGESAAVTISGHPALRRSITGEAEGVKLAYLHTCVDTDESLVQIICWTLAGREKKAFPTFEQVAATFTENRAPATPQATEPAPASR